MHLPINRAYADLQQIWYWGGGRRRILWISPCLPSGAKHNKVWEFPLPRVKEGE